jgi:hypothetical protein
MSLKIKSEQPLLVLFMGPVCHCLGYDRRVATSTVVDNQIDLDLVFYGLTYNFGVSSIISGPSMPLTILSKGEALA